MVSTFHGLEVAKRGLTAQQTALYTTGHNVANANTPGYTRQRVNLEQTSPFPSPSINRPQMPGQLGTGVQAGSVERVRDSFIDDQFRGENNKLGYWSTRSQALSSMEIIMNEPTEQGLANTLDQFWQSLQDLSVTPQDSGTRSVVRQRGMAVADTFNYLTDSLLAVQKDYKSEIDVTQKAINSIIKQLNDVNQQIGAVEVHGNLPNDLYDKRDLLLDDLSTYVNINVDPQNSGGLSSSIAEGIHDIYLADQNGNILKDGSGKQIKIVDSQTSQAYGISLNYESTKSENPVGSMNILKLGPNGEMDTNTTTPDYSFTSIESYIKGSSGSLKAHIESYGYNAADGSGIKGSYTDMMRKLDEMAFTFAQEFNEVHRSGWSLAELETGVKEWTNFYSFEGLATLSTNSDPTGAAKAIRVHQDIINSTDNIAASGGGTKLSEQMVRPDTNNSTGTPTITGIPDFPNDAAEMDVELKVELDGADLKYSYSITTGSTTEVGFLDINNNMAELSNGLKLDLSNISGIPLDTWSLKITKNDATLLSDTDFAGSGSNATALANVKDTILNYGGSTTSVTSFYQSVIGDMGVQASQAKQMTDNSNVLRDSVLMRRESVSSVSLDEEMTDMIKFQHAYNAAARNITMIDEMLDRIINNMGVVGR